MNKKHIYIYDIRQANFFYQEGVELLEIGKGNRGDAYFKFTRDELTQNKFEEWVANKDKIIVNMYDK